MLKNYISHPLSANLPLTLAKLLLDIINMFNAISRESTIDLLKSHETFSCLLPLFDLLYDNANTCWFLIPNHLWSYFH
jgi:hypothetical protein